MITMRNARAHALAALLLIAACGAAAGQPAPRADPMYVNPAYDVARDPAADVQVAIARARAERRVILVEVGGDWCVWCHILDRYLAANTAAREAFARAFIIVKVNYDPQHRNAKFLSAYPVLTGYPAFVILDTDGKFAAVQDTSALEKGRSYDETRMIAFARRWTRG